MWPRFGISRQGRPTDTTVRYNIRIPIATPPGFPILDLNNNDYALLRYESREIFYTGKGSMPIEETYFCMSSSAVPSQLAPSILHAFHKFEARVEARMDAIVFESNTNDTNTINTILLMFNSWDRTLCSLALDMR